MLNPEITPASITQFLRMIETVSYEPDSFGSVARASRIVLWTLMLLYEAIIKPAQFVYVASDGREYQMMGMSLLKLLNVATVIAYSIIKGLGSDLKLLNFVSY
uniref:Uncharacterized protein n=1 Tax=Panagrolaimus sp. PS1159 TaxID=55785 RepID=A0AC35GUR9_9BILA